MLPPDLEIEANRTLVFAIFRNLVENSLKYAGDHITIHIECSGRKSDLYQFKYYDTGKGVGREHLKRIFERFYRIQEGRTRDAGGSGLGLSIVRNAILFHGGDISALAHHGGGLEYRFPCMHDSRRACQSSLSAPGIVLFASYSSRAALMSSLPFWEISLAFA